MFGLLPAMAFLCVARCGIPHLQSVMPRILRIINRFNIGGPTYNAAYLSRYLSPEFETMLIGGSPQPGEAHSGYIPDGLGVAYSELPSMGRSLSLQRDLASYRAIREIIRTWKPDIVHTHAAKAGVLGRIAADREGVRAIVHTYHGHVFEHYFSPWKSQLVQRAEQWLATKSDAIVAISQSQRYDLTERFRIAPASKVHVIPLGFDLARFEADQRLRREAFRRTWGLKDGDCAVGLIGRFAPVKDHPFFLRAFAQALRKQPGLRAFLIGDGPSAAHLRSLALELGMTTAEGPGKAADVVFTSWIRDVSEVIHGLDIVALSSRNEGTPVSLIEAQAAGIAVISTDVGGVRDAVPEEYAGSLIRQGDMDGYARQLLLLAGDPALRASVGAAGAAFAHRNFHVARLAEDTRRLYRSLLR
jgi:glycosyltransferase involved in cell wall biosynthesis